MKLNGSLPRDSSFAHRSLSPPQLGHDVAIATAARAASIPRLIRFSRQRSRACSSFSTLSTALITGTPYSIAICWSAFVTEWLRCSAWLVLPLNDHADRDDRIAALLQRELADDDRNFERARHLMQA